MTEKNQPGLPEQLAKLTGATQKVLADAGAYVQKAAEHEALNNARFNEAISPKLNNFVVENCESGKNIYPATTCTAAKKVVQERGK